MQRITASVANVPVVLLSVATAEELEGLPIRGSVLLDCSDEIDTTVRTPPLIAADLAEFVMWIERH